MNNTLKKGIILGGLLGAAALVGLAMTKQGKELTADLQSAVKDLSKQLQERLATIEDVSKEKYNELVATVTDEYAKTKNLAQDAKDTLVAILNDKWDDVAST